MRRVPSNSAARGDLLRRHPAFGEARPYHAFFELSPDGALATDRAGVIQEANRAAAALLGQPARALVGRPLAVFVARHDRKLFEARLAALRNGGDDAWEVRIEPPPSAPFDAAVAVVVVPEADAPGDGLLLWTMRDVTRYRSLCREVLAQHTRLRDLSARCLGAREEEARRIAHRLHDEAAQLTASAHLALVDIGRGLHARRRERLRHVGALLDGLEESLRRLSHELRPTVLDDLGLAPALGFLAEAFTARTGIPVDVKGDIGESRLDAAIETSLYRIAQESLSNVARHARARQVRIRLSRCRYGLICSIRDDGVGFDPSLVAGRGDGGLGLLGMRERADAFGGGLDIRSSAGHGTELRVTVPLGGG